MPGTTVATFLMFTGQAEEAVTRYVGLLPDARIVTLARWGAGGMGREGTVERCEFTLAGQRFMAFDSPPVHGFGFTPAISLFVEARSADEVDRLAAGLGEGGSVMMPLDAYPFAKRFTWLADRFGVSWQLCWRGA